MTTSSSSEAKAEEPMHPPTTTTTALTTSGEDALPEAPAASNEDEAVEKPHIAWYLFDNVRIAQGYNWSGLGRGALVMSNIFLSTSLIYLASEEAGCVDEENGEVMDDCDETAYGFQPASFVSNIAVIASVLSALFMPVIGAMVDYTDHRKTVGVVVSVLLILIQLTQIGTVSSTWLAMAILQAISGFLYQALILIVYAYLPDMSYRVGEERMTRFTSIFQMSQFSSQAAFLAVVTALAIGLNLSDVVAGQMSQAINSVWTGGCFYLSWRAMEPAPKRHELPEGHSLFKEGFTQVYHTAKDINRFYKRGTRWFFLAVIFAEPSINAFTVVAVVFLDEQLGLSFTDIGVFFFVSLVASLPGSLLGVWVTRKLDPKRSYQLSMICMFCWSAGGAIVLDFLPQKLSYLSYVWGCGIGAILGWFYPTENLFFCMCLPKGQEAELSGFFVYCTQILGWLPPLMFVLIVEAQVSQTYGVVAVGAFLLIGVALVQCAAPWEEILKDSGRVKEEQLEATETEEKPTEKSANDVEGSIKASDEPGTNDYFEVLLDEENQDSFRTRDGTGKSSNYTSDSGTVSA